MVAHLTPLPSAGAFQQSTTEAISLLKRLGLVRQKNAPIYDQALVDRARSAASYRDLYDVYVRSAAYDVLLEDGALLMFRREPSDNTQLCYQFLENPYDALPYKEFVLENYGDSPDNTLDYSESYLEYCGSVELKQTTVPLRYDWSPSIYREGAHPAGHLHVGFKSSLRVAVDVVLLPHLFVHLVLRQYYLDDWEKKFLQHGPSIGRAKGLRSMPVNEKYIRGTDLLELRLK